MRRTPHVTTLFGAAGLLALALLCAAPDAQAQTYWYEEYERSVELIDAGDLAAAEERLQALLQEHPMPKANTRLPNDRYLDYLPYFQMARIQVARGDFDAAELSLNISEAFGEANADRRTRAQVRVLRDAVDSRTTVVAAR